MGKINPNQMDKSEFRGVVNHFYLKGKKATEIRVELGEVQGESASSFKTICYWMNEFKHGRIFTTDEHRSGRPNEIKTPAMIEQIHRIVSKQTQSKVREIVEAAR